MGALGALAGVLPSKSISPCALYAVIWVEYGICTVVMALRGYSQFFVLRKFAADDFVMLGAYIIQGVACALVTAATHYGLGSSITTLTLPAIKNVLKYTMISQPFGVIAPLLGRLSFMLFLLNSVITVQTVHNVRRKLLWGLMGLQVPINVIPCILQFTQCDPVDALWDPLQIMIKCQGARVVQKFGYFQGAFNALTDLILILIGLAVIVLLNMRRSNKLVLCGILSFSLLAMIAAILKTVQIRLLSSTEFSHAMGLWAIWFLTEGTVVITTASVPRLRAIIVLGRKGNKSSYNSPYNNYMPGASRNNHGQGNGNGNANADIDTYNSDKHGILMTTDLHIEREEVPVEVLRGRSDSRSGSQSLFQFEVQSQSQVQNQAASGQLQRGRSVTSRCEGGIRHGHGTLHGNGNGSGDGYEKRDNSSSWRSNYSRTTTATTTTTAGQGGLAQTHGAPLPVDSGGSVELMPVAKERSAF